MDNVTGQFMRNSTAPADIGLWYVGVGLNIIGSLFVTSGMMLQKLVHNRLGVDDSEGKTYYTEPLWVFGLFLMTTETFIDLATFGLAPVSILAPLSSVTLAWNVILAPIILKEVLSIFQILATVIIICGAILAVAFATQATPTYEIEDVEVFLTSPLFLVFEIIIIAFLIHLHMALEIVDKDRQPEVVSTRNDTEADDEGEGNGGRRNCRCRCCDESHDGCKVFYVVWFNNYAKWLFSDKVLGEFGLAIAYAFQTAALSGQTVGSAKLVIELAKTSALGGITQFYEEPIWYGLLVYTLVAVACMLKALNDMLARFEALMSVPIYQALLVIMQLATAAFLFDEFRDFSTLQAVFFPVGTLVCIFGIYLLSFAQKKAFEKDPRMGSFVVHSVGIVPHVDIRRPSVEHLDGQALTAAAASHIESTDHEGI